MFRRKLFISIVADFRVKANSEKNITFVAEIMQSKKYHNQKI